MRNENASIALLAEFLKCLGDIWIWQYTEELDLVATDCPEPVFFYTIFRLNCRQSMVEEAKTEPFYPVMFGDEMDLLWILAANGSKGEERGFYAMGPVLSTTMSESQLALRLSQVDLSVTLRHTLAKQLQHVPVILPPVWLQYGSMLYYAIHGNHIRANDIVLLSDTSNEESSVDPADKLRSPDYYHGTYRYEQRLFEMVEKGNLAALKGLSMEGQPGQLSIGDPLRQVKNENIILSAFCCRAAIRGGLSPETCYTLSDYYIQKIEQAYSIERVRNLSIQILQDYTTRVHQCQTNAGYSAAVRRCIDHIDFHITEDLQLHGIADVLGYSDYYLSAKFKKETGRSVRDYIKEQKIQQAKLLLSTTMKSPGEISQELNFSSPSFFGATFRKYTGMTPSQWRDRQPSFSAVPADVPAT